jgi:deoxyribodipyrimidine photo-lyase
MDARCRLLNDAPLNPRGRYVLYWARVNRRVEANQALARAIALANELKVGVLCYEALSYDEAYASDRFHAFVLAGVAEQERRCGALGIGYCFDLRRGPADPEDGLERLAADAACLVTDDYPECLVPKIGTGSALARALRGTEGGTIGASAPSGVKLRVEAVDASCIVPMGLFDKREYAAYTIRPKIHKLLPQYLQPCVPPNVEVRWNRPAPALHTPVEPDRIAPLLATCAIDHTVGPVSTTPGGRAAAERRLHHFLEENLRRYAGEKNQPAAHATSGLSPYLHFGQISALEVALAVRAFAEEQRLIVVEFLEELIVRRELAFNFARHIETAATLANLPEWARSTLARHAGDPRAPLYAREQFEAAATHDALWNACQRELLLRGTIHGYYRMYWGKKVIEWSASCDEALATLVHLNDRYELDGRDPNGYTNILWCFGLHDRPWAERRVFGTIRYMGIEGMRRKTGVDAYLREIAALAETGRDELGAGASVGGTGNAMG